MDNLPGANLTNMWMTNPWMFDPSQQSNQFSKYNNAPIPWPSSYYGTPVSAATGKPIQSYLDWQKANPVGTTINSAPAQQTPAPSLQSIAQNNPMLGQLMGWQNLGAPEMYAKGNVTGDPYLNMALATSLGGQGGMAAGQQAMRQQAASQAALNPALGASQPNAAPPSQGGAPNNWYAALSALANPGNPVTPGATVPLQQGYQPAGGVNQAFLQSRGWGPQGPTGNAVAPQGGGPVNARFMNALAAIQGRPNSF